MVSMSAAPCGGLASPVHSAGEADREGFLASDSLSRVGPELVIQLRLVCDSYVLLLAGREIEQAEKVVDSRRVDWHVGVLRSGDRIGEIVAASFRDGWKPPVGFDELNDRNVICVLVCDVAAA